MLKDHTTAESHCSKLSLHAQQAIRMMMSFEYDEAIMIKSQLQNEDYHDARWWYHDIDHYNEDIIRRAYFKGVPLNLVNPFLDVHKWFSCTGGST